MVFQWRYGPHLQKRSLIASEQDRRDIARRRAQWIKDRHRIDSSRLVFIDEDLDQGQHGDAARLSAAQPEVDRQGAGHWQPTGGCGSEVPLTFLTPQGWRNRDPVAARFCCRGKRVRAGAGRRGEWGMAMSGLAAAGASSRVLFVRTGR